MATASEAHVFAGNYREQSLPLLFEAEPLRHLATDISFGVRRIVASNAGVMTYHGTNTYLVTLDGSTVVIDPGPDAVGHVDDILAAAPTIDAIFITHHHRDHAGASVRLREISGAPIVAFESFGSELVSPDIRLHQGEQQYGLTCLHTPGHASDHMCLGSGGTLFSGDHVMAWATTSVSAPDGNMAAYVNSLHLLLDRPEGLYLPGHGPPISAPREFVRTLLSHRIAREAEIMDLLRLGPITVPGITQCLYVDLVPELAPAAERVVRAHLLKLSDEGVASVIGDTWTLRA